ncbi:hypothetical protein [Budvicia aquatica]|nr:hypothetical protein [Budvicia aquatica]
MVDVLTSFGFWDEKGCGGCYRWQNECINVAWSLMMAALGSVIRNAVR